MLNKLKCFLFGHDYEAVTATRNYVMRFAKRCRRCGLVVELPNPIKVAVKGKKRK